jgi:hypothetical protein
MITSLSRLFLVNIQTIQVQNLERRASESSLWADPNIRRLSPELYVFNPGNPAQNPDCQSQEFDNILNSQTPSDVISTGISKTDPGCPIQLLWQGGQPDLAQSTGP